MRIAVVSDIHGNLTAFEAVLADLGDAAPDLILHGGDLANGGSSPAEVIDRIRDLGWPGVVGNADELLCRPESFEAFISDKPQLASMWTAVREIGDAQRESLTEEQLTWLSALPMKQVHGPIALAHASPTDCWRSPAHQSSDADFLATYSMLAKPIVVYGHIHHPFVRAVDGMQIINTGSVSLSYDGDPRASYLLLDLTDTAGTAKPTIRRIEYDIEKEARAMQNVKLPHTDWMARMLRTAAASMP